MKDYPEIATPCPVRDRLDSLISEDVCGQCNSRVHDLDAMTRPQRLRLLAGAREGLCVRFRAPVAIAAMAAALGALPAAAQDAPDPANATSETDTGYDEIIVGGARLMTADERRQAELEAAWEEDREKVRRWREAKARAKAARKGS